MNNHTTPSATTVLKTFVSDNRLRIQGALAAAMLLAFLGNAFWTTWRDRPLAMDNPGYYDVERLTRLSNKGDATAQYDLGNVYFTGMKVKISQREAMHWYRASAEQGHPLAQYQLGLLLQVNGNDDEAFPWLKKAADNNIIDAQNRVGSLYVKGVKNVPSNGAAAIKYFLIAAEQGNTNAMHNLAHLLKNGAGAPKDIVGALGWMRLAVMCEKNEKVRDEMQKTLLEWEVTATKAERAGAITAATKRFSQGFKQNASLAPERTQ